MFPCKCCCWISKSENSRWQMGQPEWREWLADDLMTGRSLKAQQYWLGWTAVPCLAPPWPAHPQRLPHNQGLQDPWGRDRARQSVLTSPSGLFWPWDQSGEWRERLGHWRGSSRAGGNRVQALCWPWTCSRASCVRATSRRQGQGQDSLCACLCPSTKVIAAPGASPWPVSRGFSDKRPSSPLPRAHAKVQACKGSTRRERKEEPCPQGGWDPCQKPGLNPRTWEAVGQACRAGDECGMRLRMVTRVRKPTPPLLQSFPAGAHDLHGGSHKGGRHVGTGNGK